MRKLILPLILILFLTFVLIGNCAWLSGYDQRIKLTIDNTKIDSALSDFPVTIFFTSTQAEEIFTEFDADSDYMKCAFTASDGTTQLYAEKELFGFDISQYPPVQSGTYVKATTTESINFYPHFTTDPTKSLTGTLVGNSWTSNSGGQTNQRFHIDLGGAEIITKIYYENSHHEGAATDYGAQNFTFWGSNTGAGTFDDLVYANDEGWTELTVSQNTFDEHVALDQADPKYITVTNATAYRYYAFKFADNYGHASYLGVRRIELQLSEAIYHVKVTSVASGADTDIYYYYDNDHANNTDYIGAINTTAGAAVWDSNFKAVYHMVDATTSTVVDSTSNNNDGTKKDTNEPIEVAGKVGQGQDFDGTDDYINSGDICDFGTSDFTVEAIIKANSTQINDYSSLVDKDFTNTGWKLYTRNSDGLLRFAIDAAYVSPTGGSDITDDTYHHIAIAADRSGNAYFYVDGSQDGNAEDISSKEASDLDSGDLIIGWDASQQFKGIIDELRISDTLRSAAWENATYNTLYDTLLTYGSEETEEEEEANAIFFGINF